MLLVGIIAKKKDIQKIRKEIERENIKVVEITKESIINMKNINFKEIIILRDIKLEEKEKQIMKDIISRLQYLIINGDIEIKILKEINIENQMKIITFGFNLKSTITISSVQEEKLLICIQRNIQKVNGEIIEEQEKKIKISKYNSKEIYNELVKFVIKELHNL